MTNTIQNLMEQHFEIWLWESLNVKIILQIHKKSTFLQQCTEMYKNIFKTEMPLYGGVLLYLETTYGSNFPCLLGSKSNIKKVQNDQNRKWQIICYCVLQCVAHPESPRMMTFKSTFFLDVMSSAAERHSNGFKKISIDGQQLSHC